MIELYGWPYWHLEKSGKGRAIAHRLEGPWLFEGEEVFPELGGMRQKVQIGDFTDFGRALVIDGMTQLPGGDLEGVYTSALIFPAAISAPSRRRWLIAGGGDGPAPREALSFHDTEHVKLVDISPMVIRETQRLIPNFWGGRQADPRLEIVTRDVFAVMREMAAAGEKVDILISDLVDLADEEYTPFQQGESSGDHLYTPEGIRLFADCLTHDGVFVMQAQELSLIRYDGHLRLRRMLEKVFRRVYSYRVFIEFFGYWESFLIASNHGWAWAPVIVSHRYPAMREVYGGSLGGLYSPEVHEALFTLPPELHKKIEG